MTKSLTVLLLALIVQLGSAQEANRKIDVLHLSNGTKIKGQITKYEPGSDLEFRDLNGREMTYPEYQVMKISKKNLKPLRLKEKASLPDRGLYHTYQVALLTNTVSSQSGGLTGVELSGSIGYRVRKLNEFGLGTSIDFYHLRAGEMVVPIFAEASRILSQRPVTPVLTLRAGYGIGVVNREQDITNAQGGYMINPALGWRLSGVDGMNLSLLLGLKFQRAGFTYSRSSDDFSEVDLTYKRLQIGIKMQF